MASISDAAVRSSYELAKQVHNGAISISDAKDALFNTYSMKKSSAHDYIGAFICMTKGVEYKRTINTHATEYYLANISKDFGDKALEKAIASVSGHIKYYKKLTGTTLVSIVVIRDKFQKELEKGKKKVDSDTGDKKFNKKLRDFFNAEDGAYSKVTFQESDHGQITFTGHETTIILGHFGKSSIHIGAKKNDKKKATKEFYLYNGDDKNNIIELTVNYPKPNKSELQTYMNKTLGFGPKSGDIWFVFKRKKEKHLFIGSMRSAEWNILTRNSTSDYEDDQEDNLFQAIVNMPEEAKAKKIVSSLQTVRNYVLAKKLLKQESYLCEGDKKHITFNTKSTGKPYAEVPLTVLSPASPIPSNSANSF